MLSKLTQRFRAPEQLHSTSAMEQRAINTMLGQFIGDALGTRYEFEPRSRAEIRVQKDITAGGGHLKIMGGGPFALVKGQVTDDTELAMALARSLLRTGKYDIDDVAKSYYDWYESDPFDIGSTTRAAFYAGASSGPGSYSEKILASSRQYTSNSLSNGCLMRISPLAVAGANWHAETLAEVARSDCRLTNPSSVAQDAVAVYTAAIAAGIKTGDPEAAYNAAVSTASYEVIQEILQDSKKQPHNPEFPGGIGYLGIALQRAFHELTNTKSFYGSMLDVVKFGGDTDTNGCIAGALLGSVISDDSLPEQWVKSVTSCKPKNRLRKYPWVDASDIRIVAVNLLKTETG